MTLACEACGVTIHVTPAFPQHHFTCPNRPDRAPVPRFRALADIGASTAR